MENRYLHVGLESFPEKKGQQLACCPSKLSKLVMPQQQRLGYTVQCVLQIACQMLANTSDTAIKCDT